MRQLLQRNRLLHVFVCCVWPVSSNAVSVYPSVMFVNFVSTIFVFLSLLNLIYLSFCNSVACARDMLN